MSILLVRHAKAGRRADWIGPDHLRPLSEKGRRQADGLIGLLAGRPVTRVLSSPSVRCVETVEPLAAVLGLAVETTSALAEGVATAKPMALVRGSAAPTTVLCTHGDVIPAVLDALEVEDRLYLPPGYAVAKGSTWELEEDGGRVVRACYIPPPGP